MLPSMEGRGSWAIMRDIGCLERFLVMWFGGLGRSRGGGGGRMYWGFLNVEVYGVVGIM